MDHIDEALTNNSLDSDFEPSIRAALGLAKKKLNFYYNATDHSEVYRIAMGMCFIAPVLRLTLYGLPFCFQFYILIINSSTSSKQAGHQAGSELPRRLSGTSLKELMLRRLKVAIV
jgi:hypothetical protein